MMHIMKIKVEGDDNPAHFLCILTMSEKKSVKVSDVAQGFPTERISNFYYFRFIYYLSLTDVLF